MIKGKQAGNATILALMAIVVLIIAVLILSTETIKSRPPKITIKDRQLVDAFIVKPTPEINLQGLFRGVGKVKEVDWQFSFYFGFNSSIAIEALINGKHKLAGSAKYHFEGSVLKYEDIVGDKILFPEIGTPITVIDGETFIYHEFDANDIHMTKIKNKL
jgi:hypothetical protein